MFPWAITIIRSGIEAGDAWTRHAVVFGGSSVFSFFDLLMMHGMAMWMLLNRRVTLLAFEGAAWSYLDTP